MWRDRIEAQPMFDILSMANKRAETGNYVARMEIGDTPGFKNSHIHDLISKYSVSEYRYSPSQGEKVLRESVIASQWPTCSPDNIVIGPANFLITAALASCTSPNDLILLPDPGFPTYRLSANFLGLQVIYYPINIKGEKAFPDLDSFVKDLGVRPKAIVLNNPSNPLGIAFSGEAIKFALRNFSSMGISVVIDETYVNLVYDDINPLIDEIPATRIRTLSKEHCAPGLRVGYALSDSDKIETMSNLMSLSISCIPQFIQFAVAEYLQKPASKSFVNDVKSEMKRRFGLLSAALSSESLPSKPNSTFYAMLAVGDGDTAFKFLLDRNVSTCPGVKFGNSSKSFVRVSLAGAEETFSRDIQMLIDAIAELNVNL